MPIEIEQHTRRGLSGTSWTTTRAAPTKNAPFAGFAGFAAVQVPAGKVMGMKVGIVGKAPGRAPSGAELNALFLPVAKALQFETVGDPKYILDDNPVWSWKYDKENGVWEASIASGPFAGTTGDVISPPEQNYVPTMKETLENPKAVFSWSVLLRPIDGDMSESRAAQLTEALRAARKPYSNLGIGIEGSYKVVAVDAPQKSGKTKAIGTAALIGIGLSLLTWGAGR